MMQDKNQQKRLIPVSNVQKSFSSECQICYEQFNSTDRIPMIICSNYHSLCSTCVKEKLFKKQYDQKKDHTGRYKCSKCSQIIKNDQIRQHRMLKQICQNIFKIKQKDQQLKRQLYNSIGSMGMNLLSKNIDYGIIQKNSQSIKYQNQKLIEQNIILKSKLERIEQIRGSLQDIQKVEKQLKQLNYQKAIVQASFYSLTEENQRQRQKLQQLEQNCQILAKQIKNQTHRKNIIIEQIEGQIALKQYLQQEILQLKSLRKNVQKQFQSKKQKFAQTIFQIQNSWKNFINLNYISQIQEPVLLENNKENFKKLLKSKSQSKQKLVSKSNNEEKMREKEKKIQNKKAYQQQPISYKQKQEQNEKLVVQQKKQQRFIIDFSQKQMKNFELNYNIATLSNNRSGSYLHFSSENPIQQFKNKRFSIKFMHTQDFSMMFGLISADGKNKKNLYNRNSFIGLDCSDSGRIWVQGGSIKLGALKLVLKDIITVELNLISNEIIWYCNLNLLKKVSIPLNLRNKKLYPVVLMINAGDSIQIMDNQEKK